MSSQQTDNKHKYEYTVNPDSHSAPAFVVQLVGTSKRVLEIGCGPGSITRLLAEHNHCNVTGVEVDSTAIEKSSQFCEAIIQTDLNSPEWPLLLADKPLFDVVVAADVLEHLYAPWTTIKQMAGLLNPEGYLVISLPHAGHAAIAACLIAGDFQYRDWGLLDKTHIRFFCLKNIEDLLSQANLKIAEVKYVIKPPEETEFGAIWNGLPEATRRILRDYEHANIYQVVVKATPANSKDTPVALQPKGNRNGAVPLPFLGWCRKQIAPYLSQSAKLRIRKLFGIFKIKL